MRNVREATIGQYCRAAVLTSASLLLAMGMGSEFALAQDLPAGEEKKQEAPAEGVQKQKRNLKTVAEALRLATGLAVFSNGGQGTLTEVKIRGSNSQQVLVMI